MRGTCNVRTVPGTILVRMRMVSECLFVHNPQQLIADVHFTFVAGDQAGKEGGRKS